MGGDEREEEVKEMCEMRIINLKQKSSIKNSAENLCGHLRENPLKAPRVIQQWHIERSP